MAADFRKKLVTYGLSQALTNNGPLPIVARRVPTASDKAQIGQLWIATTTDDVFCLTSVVANVATWINCGGAGGVFDTITTTGAILGGTTITATTGVTVTAFGRGMVQSSVAGVLSAINGTNGQVLVGSTGGDAAWATIASATLNITPGPNTLQIEYPGGVAASFVTDAGGPIVPLLGATTVTGYDANITTDGTVANTIQIRLADDVTTVASLTASADFDMLAGTFTVESDTNAANAIYIHADGGANEEIDIHSTQGTSAQAVRLRTDAGGITIAAATTLLLDAVGVLELNSSAGVIGIGNDAVAQNINIGTGAAARIVTIGNVSGASQVVLNSGTAGVAINTTGAGDFVVTSADTIIMDCAGVLELNSSAGIISIGNDAVAQNINIGTGAAARIITIGNVTNASQVVINSGTAGVAINTTGIGDITLDSDDMLFLDADGVLELNSSGGAISIGNDADAFAIGIGTGAAQRVVTIGNATGTTSVIINAGTGNVDIGVNAIDHTSRLGSVTGVSATTIQAGTGALTLTAGGALTANVTGAYTMDAASFSIDSTTASNVTVTGAGADVTLASVGGSVVIDGSEALGTAIGITASDAAGGVVVTAGTGGISLDATAGNIDINSTTGLVTMTPVTDTQAGAAVTINANVGIGIFTGLVTAAAASQVLTITNALCTANSALLASLSNLGANDAQCTITRIVPGAGSFTVTYQNLGAAALNGNVILTFWIIKV